MKKLLCFLLPFTLLFLAACSSNHTVEENKAAIADYFPLKSNVYMAYEGSGNEYAEEQIYVDHLTDNTIQIRSTNPGTTTVKVYKIANGELQLVFFQGETYYLADFTTMTGSTPDILLKEPLVKGTEWTSPQGDKRYISDVDADVETPSGQYKALVVTTESADSTTRYYYVKDIGLVKKEFVSGDTTVTTSLKTIKTDAANEINVTFYYPDFKQEKLAYVNKKLTYKTNDSLIPAFEDNFRNPPGTQLTKDISDNTKINVMYLDQEKGMANIDFTKSLVTDMNAGSGLEGMILQSIVNTLGSYYQVEKVFIRLDGEPYQSGHFMLTEDNWFTPDYTNSHEFGA